MYDLDQLMKSFQHKVLRFLTERLGKQIVYIQFILDWNVSSLQTMKLNNYNATALQ